MATVDQLVIELRAQTAQFEQGMDRASKTTNQLSAVARRAQQAVVGLVGAMGAREVIQYADTYKSLSGRLALVTKDSQDLAATQENLFRVAQESRVGFESVVTLYTRLSRSTKNLGYESQQLQRVTETLSKATIVSGATSQEASNALVQLSQGLASGALRGDEFRSVSEQLPVILEIIEKQTGKTRGELREMAEDGKITSKLIVDAVTAAAGDIDEQFKRIPKTVSQALTLVDNAFLKYIGQSQAVAAGTGSLTTALTLLADNFDDVADAAGLLASVIAGRYLFAMGAGAAQTIALRVAAVGAAGAMTGLGASMLAAFGGPVGLAVAALSGGVYLLATRTTEAEKAQAAHNERMIRASGIAGELAMASADRARELRAESAALIKIAQDEIASTQARIESMKQLSTANALSVSRTGMTPAQLNAPRIDSANALLQKQIDDLEKLKASLEAPARSGGGFGGIAGDAEKAKKNAESFQETLDQMQRETSRDVYTSGMNALSEKLAQVDFQIADVARRYDQELTPAQKRQIETIKENVRTFDRLQEEQRQAEALAQSLGGAFNDAFEQGILGAESFSDALGSLGQQIERILFRTLVTSPLNDLVSGIAKDSGIGDFFGDIFRAEGGAVQAGMPYVVGEKRPEIFVPSTSGRIVPNASGAVGGGGVQINVINNSSAEVRASASPNANGGTDIRVMIDEAVANNIGTRGTKTAQALNSFNSQALVRR